MRDRAGHLRPLRLRDLRRLRARRARRAPARLACDRCDVAGRPGRLHAVALAERRLQVRPHDHAARRRGLPGRHRRRARDGGPKWLRDHLPEDGSAQLADLTSAWCTLGIWGPRARDILASVTSDDVSHEGFPFGTCRTIEIGPLRVLASRISYVGDLGWELYVPIEQGARLWDIVWEAGRAHGAVPAGIGVYGTTGRLEKCYRAYGTELESEYTVVEAGMTTAEGEGRRTSSARRRTSEPATRSRRRSSARSPSTTTRPRTASRAIR